MPKRKVISIYESPSSMQKLQKFLDQGYYVEKTFKFSGSGGLTVDSYILILVKEIIKGVEETPEQRCGRKNGVKEGQ